MYYISYSGKKQQQKTNKTGLNPTFVQGEVPVDVVAEG